MNKNQKSLTNKGFSLVELIIVIAIMAVLIGALAPQYTRYVERSRVSTDTQLLNNVYQTLNTCFIDPTINDKPTATAAATTLADDATDGDFWHEVYEILGVDNYSGLSDRLQATGAGDIQYTLDANGTFTVTNTNSSGTITIPTP